MLRSLMIALATLAMTGCTTMPPAADPYTPQPETRVRNAEWTKSAVIYQINTRQFTPEGTFTAAQKQLPRLKALGVDILWLMPIHPIGEKNRKGTLGSPYSVKDYRRVNPEFGTLEDLKAFVAEAHRLEMKVILDWVANHTAWDHPWVTQHPDWYLRDWKGDFRPTPWWDWSDIIDLDYSKAEMRREMTAAMKYWVETVGIDGYRCDVAAYVPTDFWNQVRRELESVKPVFMLAEADVRDLHVEAFDATYAWGWNNALHSIAMGKADTGALFGYYSGHESTFPRSAMRLMHVVNHDQNAWEATEYERFGDAVRAAVVLSVVGDGIPMMYNGQEAGNRKRLAFFEKDPIQWRDDPMAELYRSLFALKKKNAALWNGKWGAPMVSVVNSAPQKVLSFVRQHPGGAGVFAVFNLSPEPRTVTFQRGPHYGAYTEHFSGEAVTFAPETALTIPAWGYRIYQRGAPQ